MAVNQNPVTNVTLPSRSTFGTVRSMSPSLPPRPDRFCSEDLFDPEDETVGTPLPSFDPWSALFDDPETEDESW